MERRLALIVRGIILSSLSISIFLTSMGEDETFF